MKDTTSNLVIKTRWSIVFIWLLLALFGLAGSWYYMFNGEKLGVFEPLTYVFGITSLIALILVLQYSCRYVEINNDGIKEIFLIKIGTLASFPIKKSNSLSWSEIHCVKPTEDSIWGDKPEYGITIEGFNERKYLQVYMGRFNTKYRQALLRIVDLASEDRVDPDVRAYAERLRDNLQ